MNRRGVIDVKIKYLTKTLNEVRVSTRKYILGIDHRDDGGLASPAKFGFLSPLWEYVMTIIRRIQIVK
jgi:hypothetical protein